MKTNFLYSIIFFVIVSFATSSVFAANVVKKMKRKKRYVIEIDVGKLNGYEKGTKVCVYSGSGKKVACGKIIYARDEKSRFSVPKKRYRKVKKGMEVRATEADAVASASGRSKNDARTNFKAQFHLTPLPVAKFNKVSYLNPPANGGNVDSLWETADESGMQIFGVGLEFEIGVGESMSTAFGGRFKMYQEFLVNSNYTDTDPDKYADTNIKASSLGLWFDFYFLNVALSPGFNFKMSSGLDYDQTTAVMISDRLSDNESDDEFNIIDSKSVLSLLSLRVGGHFAFVVEPVGFGFGLNLLIPATEISKSIEGSSDDPNGTRLAEGDQIDDVDKALALSKDSVGAEVVISTFIIF